jgi:hypothetical protein
VYNDEGVFFKDRGFLLNNLKKIDTGTKKIK